MIIILRDGREHFQIDYTIPARVIMVDVEALYKICARSLEGGIKKSARLSLDIYLF